MDDTNSGIARDGEEQEVDRLLDEVLLDLARPTGVNLRSRVIAALGEDTHGNGRRVALPAPGPWRAAVVTAVAVVVLVVVAVLVVVERKATTSRKHQATVTALRQAPAGSAPSVAGGRVAGARGGGATASDAPGSGLAETEAAAMAGRRTRHLRRDLGPLVIRRPIEPVDTAALTGPYLPGAPAGELGDPIVPMPPPPPIAFAPIAQASIATVPPVSDIAQPVTEFPADTQPPASAASDSGTSGGTRR